MNATRRSILAGAHDADGWAATASAANAQTAPGCRTALHPRRRIRRGRSSGRSRPPPGRCRGCRTPASRSSRASPTARPHRGKNRYMPPKKPTPWTGVRESFAYTMISPQTLPDLRGEYGMMIEWDRHVGGMGEDVLTVNVWTPGVNDGGKRPVMVSFHGGGWTTGSGNAPGFDGAQLASLRRRGGGDGEPSPGQFRLPQPHRRRRAPPEFAYAGVTGVMDMTASLEWVRDNIAQFRRRPQTGCSSSASRAGGPRPPPCSAIRTPRACSTARRCRADRR